MLSTICLALLPAGAHGQASGDVSVTLDPAVAGKASQLSVVARGQAVSSGQQSPKSLSLRVLRGFRIDPRSRAARCSADQARAFECPKESRIAVGAAVGEATVAPFPPIAFTASIEAFVARPVQPGDIAGIVVQVREPKSGRQGSITGRLLRLSGDAIFGTELRFDDIGLGGDIPPGASIRIDRFELRVEAHRTVRRVRTVKRRVTTSSGTRVQRRREVTTTRYDLITNPLECAGSWAYQVRATFSDSETVRDGVVPCSNR